MTQTFEAVFDGTVLRPIIPLALEPNTRVLITVEVDGTKEDKAKKRSFIQTALSLKLEGPADASNRVDDYLYGNLCDDRE